MSYDDDFFGGDSGSDSGSNSDSSGFWASNDGNSSEDEEGFAAYHEIKKQEREERQNGVGYSSAGTGCLLPMLVFVIGIIVIVCMVNIFN